MNLRTINISNEDQNLSYDVLLTEGLFENLTSHILKLKNSTKIVIIAEERVAKIYLDNLCSELRAVFGDDGNKVIPIIIAGQEEDKSLSNFCLICEECLSYGLSRSDIIIALGGGVVGDMTGYVASSLLRGIRYINIPTTLLSQVDSSIGGKVAVNSKHGKNLIGAFCQPSLVYISLSTLASLKARDLASGYAEVVKAAFIQDSNFFSELELAGDVATVATNKTKLAEVILKSIDIKAKIVEADSKERDIRAILNFGHTFGHAFEKASNYNSTILTHGEAVSLGMVMAAKYCCENYGLKTDDYLRLVNLLEVNNLPTNISEVEGLNLPNASEFYNNMLSDKKNYNNKVSLVVCQKIGQARLADEVDQTSLLKFLEIELAK